VENSQDGVGTGNLIQIRRVLAREIRRVYDEKSETWFFSFVDIVQVLTQQPDFQSARKYWNTLRERLRREGSESVTNCPRLKLPAVSVRGCLHRYNA
jgi:hypothetical protein